jgi:spore coat polysaccharide biosynthesis protein SpsF
MKIVAVLQARMSSSRLPGKVLKPLCGEPMLWRQIERVNRSKLIDKLIVATSDDASDDKIVALCNDKEVTFFRGDLDNVLDRFYHAVEHEDADYIVRLTGDCPLADHELIDQVIRHCIDNGFDYSTNALDSTFPDGLDVEVFRYPCLAEAHAEANMPSQIEHVTPFIHQQPQRYRIGYFKGDENLSYMRWTVDEKEDYMFVSKIYEALFESNRDFLMTDVLKFLSDNPDLIDVNQQYLRNEGYEKSLREDQEYIKSQNRHGD